MPYELLLRHRLARIEDTEGRCILHATRVDVKAVTLHRFGLKKLNGTWEGFAVLDI